MDKILSYLPDTVHVCFGWEQEPDYFGAPTEIKYSTIVIPKSWIKHGERGRYDEWSIKETHKKKLAKEFGHHYLETTERIQILEWNQLENVVLMINDANAIGFTNLLEIAKTVDPSYAKYDNVRTSI